MGRPDNHVVWRRSNSTQLGRPAERANRNSKNIFERPARTPLTLGVGRQIAIGLWSNTMIALVNNVIWPAVAGNILWAFLQVASGPIISDPSFWLRLASLLFVGVYLAIDWVNTQKENKINENYWKFDLPLAASLATFAIGTQLDVSWTAYPLAAAFLVAIVGHCKGAWDSSGQQSSCKSRAARAGFNALGLLILFVGMCAKEPFSLWLTPAAIILVVVLFLSLRKKVATWGPAAQL